MHNDLIQERLEQYTRHSKQEELNALKEVCQEIVLAGLSRGGFFKAAAFQGGTCLRIVHGIRRFSEDLDFILMEPTRSFVWSHFLHAVAQEFAAFQMEIETIDRSQATESMQRAFVKHDSFGQLFRLKHKWLPSDKQKVIIKLEIDTNPPVGSIFTSHVLDYPYPFSVTAQDLPSLFASKCHALLCRDYVKGRDWYDFLWYVQHRVQPNIPHLTHALEQAGPYRGQQLRIDMSWLTEQLGRRIDSIDWAQARADVERFLVAEEQHTVANWSGELFKAMAARLRTS